MHALRAVPHVVVGLARGVVALVVLARARQCGERGVHFGRCAASASGSAGAPENGALINTTLPKHVRPHQRAPRRHPRAEVVADHGVHAAHADRRQQAHRIAHQVEKAERAPIAVVAARRRRWCGRSRAGRARPRGSPPRPVPASPCASCRRARESRAAATRMAARPPRSRPRAGASPGRCRCRRIGCARRAAARRSRAVAAPWRSCAQRCRHACGDNPVCFLNARLNAASDA